MDVTVKKTEQIGEVTEQKVKQCCQAILLAKEVKPREVAVKELIQMSPIIKERKLGVGAIIATLVQVIHSKLLCRDQINLLLNAFELMPFFTPEPTMSNVSETWAEFFSISHSAPEYSTRKALAYLKFIEQDDKRFQEFKNQLRLFAESAYDLIKTNPKPSKKLLASTFTFTDNPRTLPELLRNERFDRRYSDFRRQDLDPVKEAQKDSNFTLSTLRSKIKSGLLENQFKESDFSSDLLDRSGYPTKLIQVIVHEFPLSREADALRIKSEIEQGVKIGLGYKDIEPCVEIHNKKSSKGSDVLVIMINLEQLLMLLKKRVQGEPAVFVPPSMIDSTIKM